MGEEVWLDSGSGIDLRPEERACGFMFQDYALFPHLSAWRNVAFGMPGPRQDRRRARPGAAPALRRRGACRRPPRLPLGRRAPAGGAGAITGPRPERPAPRRAPGRARHPHPCARRPRARPRAERDAGARDRGHPRLLGGGNAGRRDLRHGRGTHRPARDAPRSCRRDPQAPSSPTSRARWCSPARRGRTGRTDAGRARRRGRAPQHRPDPGTGRGPRLSLGDQPRAGRRRRTRARPSTASRSRSYR